MDRYLRTCNAIRYSSSMTNGAHAHRTIKPMAKIAADNLSAELARKGLSDREAANRLGLSNVYVSRRANGSVEMSVSDLDLFASFLGIPVLRLLEDQDARKVVKLPGHDSNVEPIGSRLAPVSRLSDHTPTAKRHRPRKHAQAEVIALRAEA